MTLCLRISGPYTVNKYETSYVRNACFGIRVTGAKYDENSAKVISVNDVNSTGKQQVVTNRNRGSPGEYTSSVRIFHVMNSAAVLNVTAADGWPLEPGRKFLFSSTRPVSITKRFVQNEWIVPLDCAVVLRAVHTTSIVQRYRQSTGKFNYYYTNNDEGRSRQTGWLGGRSVKNAVSPVRRRTLSRCICLDG